MPDGHPDSRFTFEKVSIAPTAAFCPKLISKSIKKSIFPFYCLTNASHLRPAAN